MKNDLISRSALMDHLRGNVFVYVTPALEQAVKDEPTAYDVDKVVKQLKNEKQTSASARAEAIIGMCGASANHYGGEECAYEKAIKIAKAGGANE